MKIRSGVLAAATTLLPSRCKQQYLAEWIAERESIRASAGAVAALVFQLQVLLGAPRLGFTLRSARRPVIFDWFVVSLTLLVPGLFYVAHSFAVGEPLLGLAYGFIVLGLAAFSRSVWTADTGLIGQRASRIGLGLTVIAATAVPITHSLTDATTPMEHAAYLAWPPALITTLGAALLAASSWWGGARRVAAVHFGLLVLISGLGTWIVVVVANAAHAETLFERAYHLCIVPSAIAVIHVSLRIRKTGARFVTPTLDVIVPQ